MLKEGYIVGIKSRVGNETFRIDDVLRGDKGGIKYLVNGLLHKRNELEFDESKIIPDNDVKMGVMPDAHGVGDCRGLPTISGIQSAPVNYGFKMGQVIMYEGEMHQLKGIDPDLGLHVAGKWCNPDLIHHWIEPPPLPPVKQAKRYNAGKPELSYVLDFPKAFAKLTGAQVISPCDLLIENIPDGNIPAIIVGLFRELQYKLNPDHAIPAPDDTIGKFIASYPDAITEFVTVCANGALKYERNNYKKGFPPYTLRDSGLRHYQKYYMGIDRDIVDGTTLAREDLLEHFGGDVEAFKKQFTTHHLAHCIWNFMVEVELE